MKRKSYPNLRICRQRKEVYIQGKCNSKKLGNNSGKRSLIIILVAVLNALNPVHHLRHPGVDARRVGAGTPNAPRDNTHLNTVVVLHQMQRTTRITLNPRKQFSESVKGEFRVGSSNTYTARIFVPIRSTNHGIHNLPRDSAIILVTTLGVGHDRHIHFMQG